MRQPCARLVQARLSGTHFSVRVCLPRLCRPFRPLEAHALSNSTGTMSRPDGLVAAARASALQLKRLLGRAVRAVMIGDRRGQIDFDILTTIDGTSGSLGHPDSTPMPRRL